MNEPDFIEIPYRHTRKIFTVASVREIQNRFLRNEETQEDRFTVDAVLSFLCTTLIGLPLPNSGSARQKLSNPGGELNDKANKA